MKLAWLLWLASVLPHDAADQTCLAATVYLEARSESTLGQKAVAEVALRRRDHGRWGDTVCKVVTAPGQFAVSTTHKGYVLRNPDAWGKAWRVAGDVMHNWSLPHEQREQVVPDADHFAIAEQVSPSWMIGEPLRKIGAHSFYRVN